MNETKELLSYLASEEDAPLNYKSSNIVLASKSDIRYLILTLIHSLALEHFGLSFNAKISPNNGAILNIAHMIKHIMGSATKPLAALYIVAREVYVAMYSTATNNQPHHGKLTNPWQMVPSMANTTKTHQHHDHAFPLAA